MTSVRDPGYRTALDEAKAEIARLREASSLSLFARLRGKLAAIERQRDDAKAEIARLTTVLEEIANQDLRQEIDAEDWDNIDWEEGYEGCVMAARAALKPNRDDH